MQVLQKYFLLRKTLLIMRQKLQFQLWKYFYVFLGTHGTNGTHRTHRTHGTNETNGTQKRKEIVAKVKKMRILSFMHLFIYWVLGVPRGSLRVPGVPRLENFAILNFTVSLGSELTAKLKKWLYQKVPATRVLSSSSGGS